MQVVKYVFQENPLTVLIINAAMEPNPTREFMLGEPCLKARTPSNSISAKEIRILHIVWNIFSETLKFHKYKKYFSKVPLPGPNKESKAIPHFT